MTTGATAQAAWRARVATETDDTKRCSKCDELKPLANFYPDKRYRKGVVAACRSCMGDYHRVHNKTPKEAAYRKAFKQRQTTKDQDRRREVIRKYGEAALALEEKRRDPATRCPTCGSSRLLVLDHDHASGRMRDVLCHPCNVVLGLVRDDPARLRALAEYLEGHA